MSAGASGFYVLAIVEHAGGHATAPAQDAGYYVSIADGWMLLEPFGLSSLSGSWVSGETQTLLIPMFGADTAEDRFVVATVTGETLRMTHKLHRVTALYVRSAPGSQ